MNEKETVSSDTVLYAQALQIAIMLSGSPKPLSTAFPPDDAVVEKQLESYHNLSLSVLRYLRRK